MTFGISSYVPLFAQGVFGGDALDAGLIVLPMSLSWPIASVIGGQVILRYGYHMAMRIGSIFLVLGAAALLPLDRDSGYPIAMFAALLVGFGMGFMTSALIISVQNAVEWKFRGVATASVQFMRTIGGSISVAIMGAILNSQLASRFADVQGVPSGASEATLLNVDERSSIAPDVLESMQRALASSLHDIYIFIVGIAVLAFVVLLFFPRGSAESLQHSSAGTGSAPPRPLENVSFSD
jgi:fucose permease